MVNAFGLDVWAPQPMLGAWASLLSSICAIWRRCRFGFVCPEGLDIHPEVFGVNFLFDFWRPTNNDKPRSNLFAAPSFSLGFNFRKSSLTAAPCLSLPLGIWADASWGASLASRSLLRMGAPSRYLAERLQRHVYSVVQRSSVGAGHTSSGARIKASSEAIRAPSVAGARKSA